MNKEDLIKLVNIYNSLLDISTKGEDTIIMANCLNNLKSFIFEQQNKLQSGLTHFPIPYGASQVPGLAY